MAQGPVALALPWSLLEMQTQAPNLLNQNMHFSTVFQRENGHPAPLLRSSEWDLALQLDNFPTPLKAVRTPSALKTTFG